VSIQKRTWLRLATVAAVALVLGPAAAWADNVIADGDGLVPVASNGLKFEVFAGSVELTSTSIIAPISVKQINCDSLAAQDTIEAIATGNTSLRYDTTGGQFIYNWQAPKTKGACYQIEVSTTDGAYLVAQFKLT